MKRLYQLYHRPSQIVTPQSNCLRSLRHLRMEIMMNKHLIVSFQRHLMNGAVIEQLQKMMKPSLSLQLQPRKLHLVNRKRIHRIRLQQQQLMCQKNGLVKSYLVGTVINCILLERQMRNLRLMTRRHFVLKFATISIIKRIVKPAGYVAAAKYS